MWIFAFSFLISLWSEFVESCRTKITVTDNNSPSLFLALFMHWLGTLRLPNFLSPPPYPFTSSISLAYNNTTKPICYSFRLIVSFFFFSRGVANSRKYKPDQVNFSTYSIDIIMSGVTRNSQPFISKHVIRNCYFIYSLLGICWSWKEEQFCQKLTFCVFIFQLFSYCMRVQQNQNFYTVLHLVAQS